MATEELLEGGSNDGPAVVADGVGRGKSAELSSGMGAVVSRRLRKTPIRLPDTAAAGAPGEGVRAFPTALTVTTIRDPSVFTV